MTYTKNNFEIIMFQVSNIKLFMAVIKLQFFKFPHFQLSAISTLV
jgi:hypothetical protein